MVRALEEGVCVVDSPWCVVCCVAACRTLHSAPPRRKSTRHHHAHTHTHRHTHSTPISLLHLRYIPVTALSVFEVLPAWILLYLAVPVYLAWAVSLILLSMLTLDTFDFDAMLDSLPAVRRMATIGFFVLFCQKALSFPHIPGGIGMCVCVVKFVWEELDIGRPRWPRRAAAAARQKDTTTSAGRPAGRCGGGRPRITTVFCIYYVVLANGFHDSAHYAFDAAPCHAAGAAIRNSTANTTNTMCSFGYVDVTVRPPLYAARGRVEGAVWRACRGGVGRRVL